MKKEGDEGENMYIIEGLLGEKIEKKIEMEEMKNEK